MTVEEEEGYWLREEGGRRRRRMTIGYKEGETCMRVMAELCYPSV